MLLNIDDRFLGTLDELQILSNFQLIAFKRPGEDIIHVKATSCNRCGSCCKGNPKTIFGNDENGYCNMLEEERDGTWVCTAGKNRPFMCLPDPINEPECCIEYDLVKIR